MPVTVKRRNARRSNVDVRNLWKKRCASHMYTCLLYTSHLLEKAKPVLKKLPGWKSDIRGIKKYEDLPENCRNYIEFVEEQIGYPITMVSNGPERHDIIYRESKFSK